MNPTKPRPRSLRHRELLREIRDNADRMYDELHLEELVKRTRTTLPCVHNWNGRDKRMLLGEALVACGWLVLCGAELEASHIERINEAAAQSAGKEEPLYLAVAVRNVAREMMDLLDQEAPPMQRPARFSSRAERDVLIERQSMEGIADMFRSLAEQEQKKTKRPASPARDRRKP